MRRFFVEGNAVCGEQVIFGKEQSHHIANVLRIDSGKEVEVCSDDGYQYLVKLSSIQKEQVIGDILEKKEREADTKVNVNLVQGLPKGDKMELIVQKCTELGIHKIIPISTERAVVKLDAKKADKKIERWQKIAQEASQQSKRASVPVVESVMDWKKYVESIDDQSKTIVLWEEEDGFGLKEYLVNQGDSVSEINIIIGPEGGLSPNEVEQLKAKGVESVTLGKRILRTETAGLAGLTMILYHYGDLG